MTRQPPEGVTITAAAVPDPEIERDLLLYIVRRPRRAITGEEESRGSDTEVGADPADDRGVVAQPA